MQGAVTVQRLRLDEHIRHLVPVGAGIHAERAADRAGDAAQEGQSVHPLVAAVAGDVHVESAGANLYQRARAFPAHGRFPKALAQADDDAFHAAVAHQHVGAEADHRHRHLGGPGCEEVRQVVDIRRSIHHVRAAAGAEPDGAGEVDVDGVATPYRRQPFDPVRHLGARDHDVCPAGLAACAPPRSSSRASGSARAQWVMLPAPRQTTRSPGSTRVSISAGRASGVSSGSTWR